SPACGRLEDGRLARLMPSAPLPTRPTPDDRRQHPLVVPLPPPPSGAPLGPPLRVAGKVLGVVPPAARPAQRDEGMGLPYLVTAGLRYVPPVAAWATPPLTDVYTDDQVLAGEVYDERRKVVPYDRSPKRLVQAFIASEDASFFDHPGIDALGTLRAAVKTVLKK